MQNNVFKHLSVKNDGVLYNPSDLNSILIKCINHYLIHRKIENYLFQQVNDCLGDIINKHNPSIIFSSYEPLGRDITRMDFLIHMNALKAVIPQAEIMVFFRYQIDWLISLYKQHIHHASNPYINYNGRKRVLAGKRLFSIAQFLNYNVQGSFFEPYKAEVSYANIGVKDVDWCKIVDCLYENFGQDKAHILFYEDFRYNPEQFINKIFSNVFKITFPQLKRVDFNKRSNKGFSLSAIKLTRIKMYADHFIPFFLIPQFIDKFLLALAHKMKKIGLKGGYKLRDNSKDLLMFLSWRNIMRLYDQLFGDSKDLLSIRMRSDLENIFREQNLKFKNKHPEILIPERYTE